MNQFYPTGLQAIADADVDLTADTIRLSLLDSGYVFDETDDFFDDVPGAAVVHTIDLAGKDTTGGVFTADDETDAISGDVIVGAVVYKWTGSAATSRLLAFFDTGDDGQPLDFTPDGGNVLIDLPSQGLFTI